MYFCTCHSYRQLVFLLQNFLLKVFLGSEQSELYNFTLYSELQTFLASLELKGICTNKQLAIGEARSSLGLLTPESPRYS